MQRVKLKPECLKQSYSPRRSLRGVTAAHSAFNRRGGGSKPSGGIKTEQWPNWLLAMARAGHKAQ